MSKNLEEIIKKHGQNQSPDPILATEIDARQKERRLTCAKAHAIAKAMNVSPVEVGKTMDLMGIRINRCQMGLFGYHPEKKVVKTVGTVEDSLRAALEKEVLSGRIACAVCWAIADQGDMPRMAVAAACETLGIKVSPCQLGAF